MKKQLKSITINTSSWIYCLACLLYIINHVLEAALPWWLIILCGMLFGAVSMIFPSNLGSHLHKPKTKLQSTNSSLAAKPVYTKPAPWFETFWGWQVALILSLTFVTGWLLVEVSPAKFFLQIGNARGIVTGIFNPNLTELMPMVEALIETIFLALMSTVFAIPFAFLISFFAARNLMPKTVIGNSVYVLIRTIATIVRSIEAIVWAIIFCVWVGIGPFAGMLALWIHSIAALIKLYSEQIENIDPGPLEAVKATGASMLQTWRYAVVPQILSPYLAFTIYRWDINVRMATIVGFVGGGGIGLALQQQQQMLAWRNVGLIMWLIALVVWVMDMVSGAVRQRLSEI